MHRKIQKRHSNAAKFSLILIKKNKFNLLKFLLDKLKFFLKCKHINLHIMRTLIRSTINYSLHNCV